MSQKRQFLQFVSTKIFKNHNIGPWSVYMKGGFRVARCRRMPRDTKLCRTNPICA
jgi:hypothetical protein